MTSFGPSLALTAFAIASDLTQFAFWGFWDLLKTPMGVSAAVQEGLFFQDGG